MAKVRRLRKRNMYQMMIKCYDFICDSKPGYYFGHLDSTKYASYKSSSVDEWVSCTFEELCTFCRLDSLLGADFYFRIFERSFWDEDFFTIHFSLEEMLDLMGWSKEYYYEKVFV